MHVRALIWMSVFPLAAALSCGASHSESASAGNSRAWLGPQFAGLGTSGAGQSIAAGLDTVTCGGHAPGGSFGPAPGSQSRLVCLYDREDHAAATIEWIVESAQNTELVHVRLTLNPDFADNTYGANAIGWPERGPGAKATTPPAAPGGQATPPAPAPGAPPPPAATPPTAGPTPANKAGKARAAHTFEELVGSDHAEFKLSDASGKLVLQFKADYLSASSAAPSGYQTLGVAGGDGKLLLGDADDVVAVSTSLDRNLNECGMPSYTVDSPATDANYTPNPDAPKWDYRVVYDVWVRADAFGSSGFGSAMVDFVHASPSKSEGGATAKVVARDCPPDWPPYCTEPGGCKRTCGEMPDEECTPPGWPPDGGDKGTPDAATPPL